MSIEARAGGKTFVANSANVRLLPGMCPHVALKKARSVKSLAANCTGEQGFLARTSAWARTWLILEGLARLLETRLWRMEQAWGGREKGGGQGWGRTENTIWYLRC